MAPLNCEAVVAQDMIERYVAGTLPEAEAEAFEAHYLECGDCWADLQAALDLKRALTGSAARKATIAPAAANKVHFSLPVRLAVAAVITLAVSAGLWRVTRTIDEPRVLRGSVDALTITGAWQPDGSLQITWTSLPGANTYRVRVTGEAGSPIVRESATSPLSIPGRDLPAGANLAVSVEAEAASGELLGRSRRTTVPSQ